MEEKKENKKRNARTKQKREGRHSLGEEEREKNPNKSKQTKDMLIIIIGEKKSFGGDA